MAEEPAAEEFRPVTPSPFVADPDASEEPVLEEPWFIADVQERERKPKPQPERPVQSDTWSGRPIGS